MERIYDIIAKKLGITSEQVIKTVELLDEGSTIPFIARYRKELTGALDEVVIGDIQSEIEYARNLNKRKEEVVRLIAEQDKLTDELQTAIMKCEKLQEVEDLYFPFRKKRKTKADIAKEKGLEPLADFILSCKDLALLQEEGKKYIKEDVPSEKDAIEGAYLILAERISEIPEYREKIRNEMLKYGVIFSKESKKAQELDEKKIYSDYYEFSEPLVKTPSHRILAVNRGENEEILSLSLKFPEIKEKEISNFLIESTFGKKPPLREVSEEIVKDALSRLILPSIEREVRNILTEKAESDSIEIFKLNLKNLLMQPPLKNMAVLALDPGYRTGCKTVVIDKNGFYQVNDVLFLVSEMHHESQLKTAKRKIKEYIEKYDIDIIAIGNGTASRETEAFVAEVLKEVDKKVKYMIVNEAGASIYSASKIAAEEFPDLDVTVRGAISIGRRIQDPMAELVKIDPKSIGIGMYQHDVNQKKLEEALEIVIQNAVNNVGVAVNSASWALLSHVSGIKKNIAKNIVDYRKENGDFKNRKELLKVKGVGAKAYEQMAGFLVISDGKQPLDGTIIHPESYHVAEEILKAVGSDLKEYSQGRNVSREKLKEFSVNRFIGEKGFGKETVEDAYSALLKDRRDPRENFDKPLLKSDILKMEDLKPGMEIEGTVRNVVAFGAFVDIGLKNDALLHISEISDKFVSDPTTVLSVGQIIKVKIKDIDIKRQRVGLTRKGS